MNTLWVIVDAMRRTVEQPKGEHVPYRAPGQQPKSAPFPVPAFAVVREPAQCLPPCL